MKTNLRLLLGKALMQSTFARHIPAGDDFAAALLEDVSMPYDTAVFTLTTPTGAQLTVHVALSYPDPAAQEMTE